MSDLREEGAASRAWEEGAGAHSGKGPGGSRERCWGSKPELQTQTLGAERLSWMWGSRPPMSAGAGRTSILLSLVSAGGLAQGHLGTEPSFGSALQILKLGLVPSLQMVLWVLCTQRTRSTLWALQRGRGCWVVDVGRKLGLGCWWDREEGRQLSPGS